MKLWPSAEKIGLGLTRRPINVVKMMTELISGLISSMVLRMDSVRWIFTPSITFRTSFEQTCRKASSWSILFARILRFISRILKYIYEATTRNFIGKVKQCHVSDIKRCMALAIYIYSCEYGSQWRLFIACDIQTLPNGLRHNEEWIKTSKFKYIELLTLSLSIFGKQFCWYPIPSKLQQTNQDQMCLLCICL